MFSGAAGAGASIVADADIAADRGIMEVGGASMEAATGVAVGAAGSAESALTDGADRIGAAIGVDGRVREPNRLQHSTCFRSGHLVSSQIATNPAHLD